MQKNRRQIGKLSEHTVEIVQEFYGDNVGQDISGRLWILAFFQVLEGKIGFYSSAQNDKIYFEPGCYGIFLPPWQIVTVEMVQAKIFTLAYASSSKIQYGFKNAVMFTQDQSMSIPTSELKIQEYLAQIKPNASVDFYQPPNGVAKKIKNKMDQYYSENLKIQEIFAQLKIDRSVGSRAFKKSYGVPPSQYRKGLRVIDGMHQLAEGNSPICVADSIGYSDLSRFYKQFKEVSKASPGAYKDILSQNAKKTKTP